MDSQLLLSLMYLVSADRADDVTHPPGNRTADDVTHPPGNRTDDDLQHGHMPPVLTNVRVKGPGQSCRACTCLASTCACDPAQCQPKDHHVDKRAPRADMEADALCMVCDYVISGDFIILFNCQSC
jgi:hypothetical protein